MKKLVLLLILIVPIFTNAQVIDAADGSEPETKVIVGQTNRQVIQDEAFGEAFHKEYDSYQTKLDALRPLEEKLRQMNITIILGTWCSDSKREVPRFLRIVDELGFEQEKVKFICVDKDKKANEINVKETYKVELVPTFIFYNGDTEVGRITEKPVKTFEEDILKILQPETDK